MALSFGLQNLHVTRGTTSSRVTVGQEYMLRLIADDPDPASLGQPYQLVLEGPLDLDLLHTSFAAFRKRHSIFRTRYEQVDGVYHQHLLPDDRVTPFEIEFIDRSPIPEAEWAGELQAMVRDVRAKPFDFETATTMTAQMRKVDTDRHLLVVHVHHLVFDAGSPMLDEVLRIYHDLVTTGTCELVTSDPIQYIDYAHAVDQWPQTPDGKAQFAAWDQVLRDASPVTMPVDLPRDEWDRRCATTPCGVVAGRQHHPVFQVELPASARDAVRQAAWDEEATPYVVYLAGLAALLHQTTGQTDDICIENTSTTRMDRRDLAQVQGLLSNWTIMRVPVHGSPTSRELIRRAYDVVMHARQNGVIHGYYQRVPRHLRRMVFNYIPSSSAPPSERGKLTVRYPRTAWPIWKRPWELHLTMVDSPTTSWLVWTGNESLYRRETVESLLHRYIEILASV